MTFFLQRYGRSAGWERNAAEIGRRSFDKLPCARITSIRFKGTFSVEGLTVFNTPSECATNCGAVWILCDAQALVQQRGGCCVLQQGLFFGAQQGHGPKSGQCGFVKAAQDELLFAGVGVDVPYGKDAGF